MVLPQPDHRRRILPESLIKTERLTPGINRHRTAPRGIDSYSDDIGSGEAVSCRSCFLQRAFDCRFDAFQVIRRILPRQIRIGGIHNHPLLSGRIGKNLACQLLAVGRIDDQRSARIRAEIKSDNVFAHLIFPLFRDLAP
jgi:hypothetical protein